MPDRGADYSHRADTASVGLPTQVGIDGELAKVGPRPPAPACAPLAGHTDGVSGMAFSPTGGC